MPVSNKMAAAGALTADVSPVFKAIRNATDVAQAVVNAAWIEWDDDIELEHGRDYLILVLGIIFNAMMDEWDGRAYWCDKDGVGFARPSHYADPQDLMPVLQQPDVKKGQVHG